MTTSNTANQHQTKGPSHCGSKPKKIAIWIAQLGFISIGKIPMGIYLGFLQPWELSMPQQWLWEYFEQDKNYGSKGMEFRKRSDTTITENSISSSSKYIYTYPTTSKGLSEAKTSVTLVYIRWINYGCLLQPISIILTNLQLLTIKGYCIN